MARKLIEKGAVTIDGVKVCRASEDISDGEHSVEITPIDEQRYVSRGGLKLEAALDGFSVSVKDMTALDVGASTGGFTDCLLQRGAKFVFCVDSGTGQLHPKILGDSRVASIEKTNARAMSAATLTSVARDDLIAQGFDGRVDIAVMDVSFISQTCILPALGGMVKDGGILISLIKPQFEVGKAAVGKGGIVKSEKDRKRAVDTVLRAAAESGFSSLGVMQSPVEGGDGNIEYIGYFAKEAK